MNKHTIGWFLCLSMLGCGGPMPEDTTDETPATVEQDITRGYADLALTGATWEMLNPAPGMPSGVIHITITSVGTASYHGAPTVSASGGYCTDPHANDPAITLAPGAVYHSKYLLCYGPNLPTSVRLAASTDSNIYNNTHSITFPF